jgi:hypothetical protein
LKVKTQEGIVSYSPAAELGLTDLIDFTDCTSYEISTLNGSTTHTFQIKSFQNKNVNDIVIDWGDNSSLAISEIDDNLITFENNIFTYTVSHTYSSENKFIIKIYGKNYFNLQAVDPVDPEVRW